MVEYHRMTKSIVFVRFKAVSDQRIYKMFTNFLFFTSSWYDNAYKMMIFAKLADNKPFSCSLVVLQPVWNQSVYTCDYGHLYCSFGLTKSFVFRSYIANSYRCSYCSETGRKKRLDNRLSKRWLSFFYLHNLARYESEALGFPGDERLTFGGKIFQYVFLSNQTYGDSNFP